MNERDQALLSAVDNKDVKAATAALEAGADVNARNKYGRAPLHLAIRRKSKTIIRKLLKAGADVKLPDKKGQLPFTLLVQNVRDVKLAAEMVTAGAEIDAPDQERFSGKTPLHYAVRYAKLDFAQWLLDQGADLEAKEAYHGETPLLMLCRSESGAMSKTELANARWLLERGADALATGEGGQTALHLVAGSAEVDFIKELLDRGATATVSSHGSTPLHYAVTTNARDREVWDLLITAGNPVSGGERPVLREAQSYWNHVAVQYLLEQGADPDERDADGKTVLQSARDLKQDKIIGVLERWQEGASRAGVDRCPGCGGEGLTLIKADATVPSDQLACEACGGMFDAETMEALPVVGLRTEGRSFLFTGKLSSMSRAGAKAKVKELGGVARSSVAQGLDYLVIGDEGSPLFGQGKKGSKMVAAEKLIAAGAPLKIISETDFLKLTRQ
jgi:ankyrin repeat protein